MSADQDPPTFAVVNSDAVALRALGFIGARPSERESFLLSSGLSSADLVRRPVKPEHLVAALDFLIANEAALLAFAEVLDLTPDAAYEARRLFRRSAPASSPSGMSEA
jgi:hypothetical protein